jgi:hypothetical protein
MTSHGNVFGQVSRGGSEFSRTMKAKWLIETFTVKTDVGGFPGLLLAVERKVTKQWEDRGDFVKAVEELGVSIELLKEKIEDTENEKNAKRWGKAELLETKARLERTLGRWSEMLASLDAAITLRLSKPNDMFGIPARYGDASYNFLSAVAYYNLNNFEMATKRASRAREWLEQRQPDINPAMHPENSKNMMIVMTNHYAAARAFQDAEKRPMTTPPKPMTTPSTSSGTIASGHFPSSTGIFGPSGTSPEIVRLTSTPPGKVGEVVGNMPVVLPTEPTAHSTTSLDEHAKLRAKISASALMPIVSKEFDEEWQKLVKRVKGENIVSPATVLFSWQNNHKSTEGEGPIFSGKMVEAAPPTIFDKLSAIDKAILFSAMTPHPNVANAAKDKESNGYLNKKAITTSPSVAKAAEEKELNDEDGETLYFDMTVGDDSEEGVKSVGVPLNAIMTSKTEQRIAKAGFILNPKAKEALEVLDYKTAEDILGRVAMRQGELIDVNAYITKAATLAEKPKDATEDGRDWYDAGRKFYYEAAVPESDDEEDVAVADDGEEEAAEADESSEWPEAQAADDEAVGNDAEEANWDDEPWEDGAEQDDGEEEQGWEDEEWDEEEQ